MRFGHVQLLQVVFALDPRRVRIKEPIVESKHAVVTDKVLVMEVVEVRLFGDMLVGPRKAVTGVMDLR